MEWTHTINIFLASGGMTLDGVLTGSEMENAADYNMVPLYVTDGSAIRKVFLLKVAGAL